MNRLDGVVGTNPRDFLAALGLLRLAAAREPAARLSFSDDGAFVAQIDGVAIDSLVGWVAEDACSQAGPQPWRLVYDKQEKNKLRVVADLKPAPAVYARFLAQAIEAWVAGQDEQAEYAAAYGSDAEAAVDRAHGNVKPTALHFTAGQQAFLETVEKVRESVRDDWVLDALAGRPAERGGANLRWDPGAERLYALMASDPSVAPTTVNAPLEWLAFRALPLLPSVPRGRGLATTGFRGRHGDMQFAWPLWSAPASLATVRSLLALDWFDPRAGRPGVGAVCTVEVRRSAQGGYGSFSPAVVRAGRVAGAS